jgi:hypothetical protein
MHDCTQTHTGQERRRLAPLCVRERVPLQVDAAPIGRNPIARGGGSGAAHARRRCAREGNRRVRRPVGILGNGRRAPRRPRPTGTGPMQCGSGRTDGHTRDSLTHTHARIDVAVCMRRNTHTFARTKAHACTRAATRSHAEPRMCDERRPRALGCARDRTLVCASTRAAVCARARSAAGPRRSIWPQSQGTRSWWRRCLRTAPTCTRRTITGAAAGRHFGQRSACAAPAMADRDGTDATQCSTHRRTRARLTHAHTCVHRCGDLHATRHAHRCAHRGTRTYTRGATRSNACTTN